MTVVHNFRDSLAWGETDDHESFWDEIYRKAFPDLVNHMACKGNTASQRQGIDRIIHLASGKTLYIDEKKRDKEYPDILLEYISVDKTNAPGWIEKDLNIDYLAYAFMPSKRCYLFPWSLLRRAWRRYGKEWRMKYRVVEAKNEDYSSEEYKTISVAVPIKVLQDAVCLASVIDVSMELRRFLEENKNESH